ncbi:MAG: hypothetical protein PF484_09615 [Bacteroidales bacterium]|jgi:hypothetical protein|nr:hypothetical protein [Bacteroidales bacterium]
MKKYLFLVICILGSVNIFGQIDLATSSVQVIGYWEKNDTRTYLVSFEEYTVTGSDTTSRELTNYQVDITIINSSPDSYTIEWFFRDYSITTDNAIAQMFHTVYEDRKVIIKTDKLGSFIEVVNWKDFKQIISKTNSILKKDFRGAKQKKEIIEDLKTKYSTKEAIERSAIDDIKQFYNFHGFKYILDEQIEGQTKVSNSWGGEAFDAKYTTSLDEIDLLGFNSVIRMKQEVNTKQLTDVIYYTTLANGLTK